MTYVISKHTHAHTNDGPDIIFAYKPQKNKSLGDSLPFLLPTPLQREVAQVGII